MAEETPTYVVNGDDVRVLKTANGLGFGMKAFDMLARSQVPGGDQLERHHAVEAPLPGAIDDAHATASDWFEQVVVAEAVHARLPGFVEIRTW